MSRVGFGDAIDVLARTVYGEARGEPVRGMEAVAAVVMNRVARPGWWGDDILSVCLRPAQFSCWNPSDPNRAVIEAAAPTDPVFAACLRISRRAAAGVLPDPVVGATHYHNRDAWPRWARGKAPCAEVGRHLFYNDIT